MKNRNLIFSLALMLLSTVAWAQKPQKILGIAKENKTQAYYGEQKKLWRLETKKDPKDANAWYQLYKAERAYLQKIDMDSWMNRQGEVYAKLQLTIDEARKHIDKSFEYYLMESFNCRGQKSADFSEKAYKVNPNRSETYEGLLIHYVLTFQEEKATAISKKMLERNYYSNSNLIWNYNELQTADENGLFITHGDLDAMPKWVLQYGKGLRKDVLVINKWLLTDIADYRKRVLKELEIQDLNKKREDFSTATEYTEAMVAHTIKSTKRISFLGCGTQVSFLKKYGLDKDMYLVGAAFKYCKSDIDNLGITIRNFEQVYDLQYLFNNFQTHPDDVMVKKYLNLSYIPGLVKLIKHYELIQDSKKADHYKKLLGKIAEDIGKSEEVSSWY
jgi:hypothetical protein